MLEIRNVDAYYGPNHVLRDLSIVVNQGEIVTLLLRSINLAETMDGPLNFTNGPAPGVAIVKPAGSQWQAGTGKYPFDFLVVDNSANKSVPIGGDLKPTNA